MLSNSETYTIIGFIIAIALAIFSPSIPKIISTTGLIVGVTIVILCILIVAVSNLYLSQRQRKTITTDKIRSLEDKYKEVKGEINFLKERFKTIEDLTEVRTKINMILSKKDK